MTVRQFFAIALTITAMPVCAAVNDDAVPQLAPVGSADLAEVIVSLLVVVGAIVACGWLYTRSQGLRGPNGNVFRIVATQALGPKERIVVIEVGGKQLVLGMTASQVSTLHVFDEPAVQRETPRPTGRETGFAERFRSILRGSNE